ncbi:MAG: SGNH/GDSL hydrolase family protein [Planctomycetota bacterium]|jgi:hypothetical protein
MARALFPYWAPRREERVKYWTYSERLGWEHLPNQRENFSQRDFSVEIAINSHGMRDDEYPMERTEKKRALVIGDSFGWGFGVEQQERFSEILENTHPDWEIINASVSGYGTDQQFLYLKEKGISFKPDLVLLLFYKNDFLDNTRTDRYWYSKPAFVVENEQLKLQNVPVPRASIARKIDRFLLGRTYLGQRFYSGLTLLAGAGKENEEEKLKDGHGITHRLITAINDLSKKEGAKFVLVSIPMGVAERMRLQKTAEAEDIPYLQLDERFEPLETSATLPHDRHWNAYGHAIAASAIDEFLRELGLFGSSGAER